MILLIEIFILIGLLHLVYVAGFAWGIINKTLSAVVLIMIFVVAPVPMRALMVIYFVIFLVAKFTFMDNVKNV